MFEGFTLEYVDVGEVTLRVRHVSLSSRGHLRSPVVCEDINFSSRPYDPWLAYGQSKTANVLFAVEATRRWAADGITANAAATSRTATKHRCSTRSRRGPAGLTRAPTGRCSEAASRPMRSIPRTRHGCGTCRSQCSAGGNGGRRHERALGCEVRAGHGRDRLTPLLEPGARSRSTAPSQWPAIASSDAVSPDISSPYRKTRTC